MNLDFKEINKEAFQCVQMPDGSVFYGETEYCHKETGEIIYNYEELSEDEKAKIKIVRHGYGIQLFGKNESDVLVKYVG